MLDPAFRTKKKNDYTGIVTVGVTTPFNVVVLEAQRVKAMADEVIEKIIATQQTWNPLLFGIETVAAQIVLVTYLEHVAKEQDVQINIRELKPPHGMKKAEFIRGALQPMFKAGQVHLSPGQHELLEELERHPFGKFDDLLNALAYGPQIWHEPDEHEWEFMEGVEEELAVADRGITGYGTSVATT